MHDIWNTKYVSKYMKEAYNKQSFGTHMYNKWKSGTQAYPIWQAQGKIDVSGTLLPIHALISIFVED